MAIPTVAGAGIMGAREHARSMKVYLETMGCQMNRLDSELAAGQLRRAGHELVADRKAADVVLYNTCSVRRHAEEKVYSRLGADSRRKSRHRPKLILGVLGCVAQKEGRDLRKRFPEVDILCAPGRLADLVDLIDRAAGGAPGVALDPARDACGPAEEIDALDLARDPYQTTSPYQAYVRVAKGCDNFCSYCIVPFVRGRERSRRPERIVQEVRCLVEAGRSEITLLGQTVNRYRCSPAGGESPTVRFSDLLERVSGVTGLRRLRFVTSHPVDFGDDVLEAMRDLPNVCEYIHVPPQSGSDAVLKRMNRGYTRRQYDDLIDRARGIVPGVVLAGDFIVGFPGETDQDFQATVDLVKKARYKNCFIFKYSPRPGTAADKKLLDNVPLQVKKKRNTELLAVQERISDELSREFLGKEVKVLVEGLSKKPHLNRAERRDKPQLLGRTAGDWIVVFNGPESLTGQFANVKITKTAPLTLFGELV